VGKVDRGYDFDRLEEAELLPVNALYVANNQPFGKNPAHAAGDNPIADPDLFLAQDEVEDQAFSLAAADTASPVVLQETGHSRRCVGNQ
jgi:fructose-specific component phosphotransferase system IIB-like protein